MSIALSGNRSVRELTELADKVAKVQLERRPGVGEVLIVGGQERAINVWLDADRLAAYGIPVTAVRDALVRQNADLPGGNVTTDVQERVLRTMGRVQTPADFANIVITNRGGVPLRIRDIGRAEDGTKEQRSLARLERQADRDPRGPPAVRREHGRGHRGHQGSDAARAGAAARATSSSTSSATSRATSTTPLHEINIHLVLGSILACLVVLLFMRSWRSTIIAGVAIPASVISTFGDDVGARLHAQQRDHARAGADGRHRHRRCDRRAREHLPLRGREEDGRFAAAQGGDRGDRAAGHGDDAQPGGHLRPGLVHVEHLRALPLPVRHHGGGRHPGQPARVASR